MLSQSELVASYCRCREITKKLHTVLTEQIPKDVLEEGGRDLGFLHQRTLVFDNEDEFAILNDYCLYSVLRKGRNAVQTLLAEVPPPDGSEESLVLHGMAKAWYSLFGVQTVQRGVGAEVQDILRQTVHFLVDLSLSRTAVPGAFFAARMIPLGGFIMTTGALLPLQGSIARREKLIDHLTKVIFSKNITSFEELNPIQEKEFARAIIKAALSWGASSEVRHQDTEQVPVGVGARVGRNDPCPCGSGLKFKKCCARH